MTRNKSSELVSAIVRGGSNYQSVGISSENVLETTILGPGPETHDSSIGVITGTPIEDSSDPGATTELVDSPVEDTSDSGDAAAISGTPLYNSSSDRGSTTSLDGEPANHSDSDPDDSNIGVITGQPITEISDRGEMTLIVGEPAAEDDGDIIIDVPTPPPLDYDIIRVPEDDENPDDGIIRGTDDDDVINGTADDDVIEAGYGDDSVRGWAGDDRIDGGWGSDWISGGEGNDVLHGHSGDDELRGEQGDDVVYGGAGDDRVLGGSGDDRVSGGPGNDVVAGEYGDDIVHGGSGNDWIYGGVGNDKLFGDAGDDVFSLAHPDDREFVSGGRGNDTVSFRSPFIENLTVDLTNGTAAVDSNEFASMTSIENVIGGLGHDTITGDRKDNIINGEVGDDWIRGKQGADTLTGGEGADTFYWERSDVIGRKGAHFGLDVITDFDVAEDTLDFSGLINLRRLGDISDAVSLEETDAGTIVSVDFGKRDGVQDIALLEDVYGIDVNSLYGSEALLA